MSASYDFTGRTILVTGAGAGIGRSLVEKLVQYGANVIAVSLLKEELDSLVKDLPQVKTIQVDVSDWNGVRKSLEGLGPIHGLVNNAGIISIAPFMEITQEQIGRAFDVNVTSIINVSQVVARNMLDNGTKGGVIVNLSSIAAKASLPGGTVYCATKAAVQSITGTMAVELGRKGIRVCSVLPTFVRTDMTRMIWSDEERSRKYLEKTPLGRFAEREEIADGVLFLLSDQAAMVNGAGLPIDGGFLL